MVKFLPKYAFYIILAMALLYCLVLAWAWFTGFHPPDVKDEPVNCKKDAPELKPGQKIKVLSWNVQYMAGKDYHFFYEGGTDKRPLKEATEQTTAGIAKIITDEDPDIILLQEVDEGAARTGYRDQLGDLMDLLPAKWQCHTSAWYWKADFVPHPDIMGSVGMKLVTLSKYRIDEAIRYQLPLIPEGPIRRQFNLKRAVLEARLPVEGGGTFSALNTHFSAFAQGTRTMEKQVAKTKEILDRLSEKQTPWLAGGDFNLLPPTDAYKKLTQEQKKLYRKDTEIRPLFDSFNTVPGIEELNSSNPSAWYTHFPNNPSVKQPDKTIDYIFYPENLTLGYHRVRHDNTLKLSDHLPVIAEFKLPKDRKK